MFNILYFGLIIFSVANAAEKINKDFVALFRAQQYLYLIEGPQTRTDFVQQATHWRMGGQLDFSHQLLSHLPTILEMNRDKLLLSRPLWERGLWGSAYARLQGPCSMEWSCDFSLGSSHYLLLQDLIGIDSIWARDHFLSMKIGRSWPLDDSQHWHFHGALQAKTHYLIYHAFPLLGINDGATLPVEKKWNFYPLLSVGTTYHYSVDRAWIPQLSLWLKDIDFSAQKKLPVPYYVLLEFNWPKWWDVWQFSLLTRSTFIGDQLSSYNDLSVWGMSNTFSYSTFFAQLHTYSDLSGQFEIGASSDAWRVGLLYTRMQRLSGLAQSIFDDLWGLRFSWQ